MSNFNSAQFFHHYDDQSEEVNRGRKYIKKSKLVKKKSKQLLSSAYIKNRCQNYNFGACNKGSQCLYSHSFIPDIAKKFCKNLLTNSCTKGQLCPYSHNTRRYPCKFFHIQQRCSKGNECKFSHKQIDPDFEQEFLKDNEEFLIKLQKQGQQLTEKYISYIKNNDLLNKQKIIKNQPPRTTINLPLIFGYMITQTVPRTLNDNQKSVNTNKKYYSSKKSLNNQLPFSIRFVHKNRTPIPQKLYQPENQQLEQKFQDFNQVSMRSQSQQQENQQQRMVQQKNSKGIELTPDSKSQRLAHGVEFYMCSYS